MNSSSSSLLRTISSTLELEYSSAEFLHYGLFEESDAVVEDDAVSLLAAQRRCSQRGETRCVDIRAASDGSSQALAVLKRHERRYLMLDMICPLPVARHAGGYFFVKSTA